MTWIVDKPYLYWEYLFKLNCPLFCYWQAPDIQMHISGCILELCFPKCLLIKKNVYSSWQRIRQTFLKALLTLWQLCQIYSWKIMTNPDGPLSIGICLDSSIFGSKNSAADCTVLAINNTGKPNTCVNRASDNWVIPTGAKEKLWSHFSFKNWPV